MTLKLSASECRRLRPIVPSILSSIAVLLYNNMKQLFTHRRAERTTVSCEKCLNVFCFFFLFLVSFCFFFFCNFFFSPFSFVFAFVFVFVIVTCIASTSAVSRMPQSSSIESKEVARARARVVRSIKSAPTSCCRFFSQHLAEETACTSRALRIV